REDGDLRQPYVAPHDAREGFRGEHAAVLVVEDDVGRLHQREPERVRAVGGEADPIPPVPQERGHPLVLWRQGEQERGNAVHAIASRSPWASRNVAMRWQTRARSVESAPLPSASRSMAKEACPERKRTKPKRSSSTGTCVSEGCGGRERSAGCAT